MSGPRFLYLHGFASSRESTKGLAFSGHFGPLGLAIDRLNLRVPSLERLRLSAGIEVTRAAIGGERDRAVLIGSSLGGLTAARAAEVDARVCALVLMTPAFQLAERWQARLTEEQRASWHATGWLDIHDHATGGPARLHHGFLEDVAQVEAPDRGWPDVRVPTLVLHGRGDQTVDIQVSRRFAAGKRHVRLVELDDGHELTASLPIILHQAQTFLAPFLGRADMEAA